MSLVPIAMIVAFLAGFYIHKLSRKPVVIPKATTPAPKL